MSGQMVPVTMGAPRFRSRELAGFCVTDAWFAPETALAFHAHDRANLVLMLDGSFDLVRRSGTYACGVTSLFVEPGEERHANYVGRRGARVVVIQPDPAQMDRWHPFERLFDAPRHFDRSPAARIGRSLATELRRSDAASQLAIEGLAMELVALVARCDEPRQAPGTPPRWLRRVEDMLAGRFRERLRLADVAQEAGVHPVHLTRVFRKHMRMSVAEYVRDKRLAWAANQLATTRDSIAMIAVQAGFADQSHLTRVFREHTGSTPERWRRACRRRDAPPPV